MTKAIVVSAAIFLASIVALVAVIAYASIGRGLGQDWTSLDGPEPIWPAVIGYGAPYVTIASALVLVVLAMIALIRRSGRARTGRQQR